MEFIVWASFELFVALGTGIAFAGAKPGLSKKWLGYGRDITKAGDKGCAPVIGRDGRGHMGNDTVLWVRM